MCSLIWSFANIISKSGSWHPFFFISKDTLLNFSNLELAYEYLIEK